MIELKNITKHYDTKTIFDYFNLIIEKMNLSQLKEIAVLANLHYSISWGYWKR